MLTDVVFIAARVRLCCSRNHLYSIDNNLHIYYMLIQVNDFAANLRDGKIELPLDDQSRALQKETRALKEELAAIHLKLQRYERELGGAISLSPHSSGKHGESNMQTNADMSQIMADNKELHAKLNSLQSELIHLIKGG